MTSAKERYRNDPVFHRLVDTFAVKTIRIRTVLGTGKPYDRSGEPTFYWTEGHLDWSGKRVGAGRKVAACRCPRCPGLWTYHSIGQAMWNHNYWFHGPGRKAAR